MGCRTSKKRYNKEGENQKLCKIGLGVGRNELKLEGNFQLGYHSKTYKKYQPAEPLTSIPEEQDKPLATIPEEENGQVLDPTVLQS